MSKFTYKDYVENKATQEAGKKKEQKEQAWENYGDYTKSDSLLGIEGQRDKVIENIKNYGDFNYTHQQNLDDIMNKILNREDFSYDLNGDALYQQYKDKYIKQGKMAMQDTMGQAAAMTGGYGNSYAATAGNQAYQASLENLNDIVPELYQMAHDRYNEKGQEMLSQYSMLSDDRNTQYGMWGDRLNRLIDERGYYSDLANNEYSKEYGQWSDGLSRLASEAAYWGDAYNGERNFDYGQYSDGRNLAYTDHRNDIADQQWKEQMDLTKAQWEWQKQQANKTTTTSSGSKEEEEVETVKPVSSGQTTSFINSHSDKNRYLQSGKSLSEFKEYIKSALIAEEDNLSDEEYAYLIRYYGL